MTGWRPPLGEPGTERLEGLAAGVRQWSAPLPDRLVQTAVEMPAAYLVPVLAFAAGAVPRLAGRGPPANRLPHG